MTKTVTAAALESAKTKLAEAQKTAVECRANHTNALNTAADHRNEACAHADKAKAARADFSNAVREGSHQQTRAELRDLIADHEALAEHHAAEAERIAESLPELQRLAEGGERFAGAVEQEIAQAEFHDALAEYRDRVLPEIAPAVRRLHAAAWRVDRSTVNGAWTALPDLDPGLLNGDRIWL
ncbi:hypothetical protein [Caballeronia telluris]|uniref:hypothetical protein n=1 Tax=Caballeronia telluris TaxID=326475 RepID=UPI000B3E6FA4|nr:hypothetical protein [Caballeronia telluris]